MFETLNEEIRRRQGSDANTLVRWLRYAGVLAVSLLAFGALYAGITLLE
jgi:hypothetical protein